jgi:hypothetical protein
MKYNNKSTVPENLIFTRVSGLIVIKLLSTSFIHLLQNRSIRTSTTWFNQNIYNMAYSVLIVQSEHLQHGIQCSDRSIRTSTTWFNQNIYNMVYSVLIIQSEHLQHGSIRTSTTWYTVFWSFNQNIYNMVQSEHLQHGIQCSYRSIRTSTTWFNQNIYNMVQSEYLQHGIQCSDFWVQVQKSYSLWPWSQIDFLSCSPSEANIICSHKNITLNRWNYTGILYLNYLNSAE